MGQIIPFRCEARRRASPPPGGEAEILFFLGVRYCQKENGGKQDNGGKDNEPNRPSRSRRKKRA